MSSTQHLPPTCKVLVTLHQQRPRKATLQQHVLTRRMQQTRAGQPRSPQPVFGASRVQELFLKEQPPRADPGYPTRGQDPKDSTALGHEEHRHTCTFIPHRMTLRCGTRKVTLFNVTQRIRSQAETRTPGSGC